ncbi:MAG TPA: hypothetical protein VGF21_09715 [Thermoleophilaceae bacterium]|jgi:hypothetical protein
MLRLATLTVSLAVLAAGPAAAEPGTTGGLPAGAPPVISPQGGLTGPAPEPATAASTAGGQKADNPPAASPQPAAAPPTAQPSQSPGDESTADPSPATEPAASAAPASGGGGSGLLPHTGFALAALIAVGTGFFLTGYALRYARALDG